MYGAMIGDYVGSIYEWHNIKTKQFPFFARRCFLTDDSYMTMAVAYACSNWSRHHDLDAFSEDVKLEMLRIGRYYPDKGYGGRFHSWLRSEDPQPYQSYGNGSAMRVSPCGFAAGTLEEAEALAKASALPTHDHPEGIKGAQAVAAAIFLARTGHSRSEIGAYIREHYYPLTKTLSQIRPDYSFDETCQETVPPAIQAFLESNNFEDAIRNAISIGGDSDTVAAITGSIAEAYYGVPEEMCKRMDKVVKESCDIEEQEIIRRFREMFILQAH